MTNTHQRRQLALRVQPQHPITPDGRYFVVRGKLWRMANPDLPPLKRSARELMKARNAGPVSEAPRRAGRGIGRSSRIDTVKRELGERGPVWWTDGAPDLMGLRIESDHAIKIGQYSVERAGINANGRCQVGNES